MKKLSDDFWKVEKESPSNTWLSASAVSDMIESILLEYRDSLSQFMDDPPQLNPSLGPSLSELSFSLIRNYGQCLTFKFKVPSSGDDHVFGLLYIKQVKAIAGYTYTHMCMWSNDPGDPIFTGNLEGTIRDMIDNRWRAHYAKTI